MKEKKAEKPPEMFYMSKESLALYLRRSELLFPQAKIVWQKKINL